MEHDTASASDSENSTTDFANRSLLVFNYQLDDDSESEEQRVCILQYQITEFVLTFSGIYLR